MTAKTTLEDISSYERRLIIEIPETEVHAEMERQFVALSQRANLKGFRPGHTPIDIIRQKFNQQVRDEALSKLLDASYAKAIVDHKLFPVAHPKIEMTPLQKEGAFKFTACVEIKPPVTVKTYKKIPLKKEKISVDEKKVEETLNHLRDSKAQIKNIEEKREVKDKDFVVIDFYGTLDGKPFPGSDAKNLLYEMGSRQFVPDFEEGLKGMMVGDKKKIQVLFPKDFSEKRLADKTVFFDVTLREIKMKEIPALDDSFAKGIEGCQTVSDLKERVRQDLKKMEERRLRQNMEKKILEELVSRNPIAAPPSMVKRQFDFLLEDSQHRLEQMGMQGQRLEETLAGWKKDLNARAEFDVKVVLLCEAIAIQEKIAVSDIDLESEYRRIAEYSKVAVPDVKAHYEKKGSVPELKWQLLQNKVIEWLFSQAEIS